MSLLRKAILVNSTAFLCLGISICQTVILTRVLGPGGIGQYSVITAVLMVATQFFSLGLPLSFLFYSQHDPNNNQKYLMSAIWACLILGAIGGLGIATLVYMRTSYFGVVPWFALVAIAIHIPIVIQSMIARNNLMIAIEARRISLMSLSVSIGSVCLVLMFYALGHLGVGQAVLCFVATGIIRLSLGGYWMRNKVDFSKKLSWRVSRKLGFMGVRQSWTYLMVIVNSQVSILIVKYLIDDFDDVGYFSRGLRIAVLGITASQSVLPILFSRWASLPQEKLITHVEKVLRFASTAAIAAVVGILLTGKWVILLLYGKDFLPAVQSMRILVPGAATYMVSRALIELLGSRGRPEISAILLGMTVIMNILLSWLLVPEMGIAGAALAATVCNIVLLVSLAMIVKRRHQIRLTRCLWLSFSDYRDIMRELSLRSSKSVREAEG